MGTHMAAMKELAKRLIAYEDASDSASNPESIASLRVVEKLRISMTHFAGADGFTALMRRAIALSHAENPGAEVITLGKDGSIASKGELWEETCSVLVAQLLDLMVTFIGEPLTLTLLNAIWPVETIENKLN